MKKRKGKKKGTSAVFPTCNAAECAACEEGRCIALNNNNFGQRKCPFFKTKEQNEKEKALCEKRLADIRTGKQED